MKSSRLQNLPNPKRRYRIDLLMSGPNGSGGFETRDDARAEDVQRIASMKRGRVLRPRLIDAAQAKNLASRLARSPHPKTFASSRYGRGQRIRFSGALLKLTEPWKSRHLRTFTLLPERWEIEATDLDQTDPRKLLQQLRSQLNRLGASEAHGFLVAILHGEFEPGECVYRLHVHGVAGGGAVKIVHQLRTREHYRPRPDVARPVRLSRLKNRPRQLSYLLKSYWPSRRIGPVGPDGKIKRTRRPQRLPEPYHAQQLLWLDKRDLSDITLLMGCKATKDGLVLTNKNVKIAYFKNRTKLKVVT